MGTLGKLVKGLIGKVPGAGAMLDIAKSVGSKVLSGVIDKIKGIASDVGVFGGNGANGQLPSSALAKASGFAPGSGVGATGGLLQKGAAAAWNLAEQGVGWHPPAHGGIPRPQGAGVPVVAVPERRQPRRPPRHVGARPRPCC